MSIPVNGPDALLRRRIEAAVEAAYRGGQELMAYFRGRFDTTVKTDGSILTAADVASHRAIGEVLQQTGLPVVSEEDFRPPADGGPYWLVDPMDGTREFARGDDQFCVLIALVEKGRPAMGVLYAPASDTLFVVARRPALFWRIAPWKKTSDDGPIAFEHLERQAEKHPPNPSADSPLRVVVSFSHLDDCTRGFLADLEAAFGEVITQPRGSALKFTAVAWDGAHVYPRLAPIHWWDIAVGTLAVETAGGIVEFCNEDASIDWSRGSRVHGLVAWRDETVRTRFLQSVGEDSMKSYCCRRCPALAAASQR